MKTYLITYDLMGIENSTSYNDLIKLIKTSPKWAKLLKSTWLVKTSLSSLDILNKLRNTCDIDDKLLIIEVTNDWVAYNLSPKVVEWMQKGL